jgi:hypothetical protein
MPYTRIKMASPRIYVYKITFLEVLHYYYGVHKEKFFNEYYMGSPVTHKDFWEFYTPIKEIIKVFSYTDKGWLEAREFENNLIEPVYNTDPLCLNENCGGIMSLDVLRTAGKIGGTRTYELNLGVHGLDKETQIKNCSKAGKIGGKIAGQKVKKNGIGIFAMTEEEKRECSIKGGKKARDNKTGIFAMTEEEKRKRSIKGGTASGQKHKENGTGVCGISKEKRQENGKKIGKRNKENGIGIFSMSKEELSIAGKKGGNKTKKLGVGICGMSKEQRQENGKKSGNKTYELGIGVHGLSPEQKKENAKKGAQAVHSQKWQCAVTGHITTPGALTRYQKKRGIDTKNRIRIV